MSGNARGELLRAPAVSWPTLLVFGASVAAWCAAIALAWAGALAPPAALLVSTVAAFAAFTPMHDAAHRSLARARLVSEIVGRICSLLLVGPFVAFRYVHLEHHKHTNDPHADPDHWSGRKPAWLRPLRWASQDLHYYVFLASRWRQRPATEVLEIAGTLLACVATAGGAFAAGHGAIVLWCWLVPSRLALLLLAFSFDYLPHRPHAVTARESEYRATHVIAEPALTPLFLYQNYHLVHHLYPGIPFHRYARVWRAQREELLRRGAAELRFARLLTRAGWPA